MSRILTSLDEMDGKLSKQRYRSLGSIFSSFFDFKTIAFSLLLTDVLVLAFLRFCQTSCESSCCDSKEKKEERVFLHSEDDMKINDLLVSTYNLLRFCANRL